MGWKYSLGNQSTGLRFCSHHITAVYTAHQRNSQHGAGQVSPLQARAGIEFQLASSQPILPIIKGYRVCCCQRTVTAALRWTSHPTASSACHCFPMASINHGASLYHHFKLRRLVNYISIRIASRSRLRARGNRLRTVPTETSRISAIVS